MSKKILMGTRPTRQVTPPAAADGWVEKRVLEIESEKVPEPDSEKEKMKRLTIDVPESLHKLIKVACAERGTKIADELREILSEKYGISSVEK